MDTSTHVKEICKYWEAGYVCVCVRVCVCVCVYVHVSVCEREREVRGKRRWRGRIINHRNLTKEASVIVVQRDGISIMDMVCIHVILSFKEKQGKLT